MLKINFKFLLFSVIFLSVINISCQEKKSAELKQTKKSHNNKTFTLKGTLINEDGTPATEIPITISNATESGWGFILETDSVGKAKTPQGITDSNGHFEINIKRIFLEPNRKITVHCFKNLQRVQLTRLEGKIEAPVVIEVNPSVKTLDLDKIIGKLKVK